MRHRHDKGEVEGLGTPQAAVLVLLGLVLAFMYAFVSNRAEARKAAVIAEANALGTAHLRADLLDEPFETGRKADLLAYARTRAVNHRRVTRLRPGPPARPARGPASRHRRRS